MNGIPSPRPERPTRVHYVVLFGLCLAAGLAYVHRACFGVAESTIRADLGLNEKQTGWAMGIFFATYALFQIPTGLLVDIRGPRWSLFLFGMAGALTLALGAATLLVGATAGFVILFASRALMGVAQAGLFPASTRCFALWFPLHERGLATGTLQSCMQIGAALAGVVTGWLITAVRWPWMFVIFAVPGVVWSLWFYGWFRDHPEEHPSPNAAELALLRLPPDSHAELHTRGPTPWRRLFTRRKLLWICAQQLFRAGANVFWLTWCPTFFQMVYLLNPAQAGSLTALPALGVVLGSFSGGIAADRVLRRTGSRRWSRQGVVMVSSAIGVAIFVAAYSNPPHIYPAMTGVGAFAHGRVIPSGAYVAAGLLFLAAFCASMGNAGSYSVTIDIGGRYTAVLFGAMNMSGNIGAFLFPIFLPVWVAGFSWAAAPLLVAGLYLLGMLCWAFVNPNGKVLE
jgi:sugar phosphate permease